MDDFKLKCICCGEDRKIFLCEEEGTHNVVCYNCRHARKKGVCPHQLEDKTRPENQPLFDPSELPSSGKPKKKRRNKPFELLVRVEKLRGSPFGNRSKQLKYIKQMHEAGIDYIDIGERWVKLHNSEWWREKDINPDMKNVADDFDRKPKT